MPAVVFVLLLLAFAGTSQARAPEPPSMLMVGDSLAVDSDRDLRDLLPGWRVRTRAARGIGLETGMRWIRQERRPPPIIAFSLFTNNQPGQSSLLEWFVVDTLRRHPGCHVWATAYGSGPNGNPFADANRRLLRLARAHAKRLVLVDWHAWPGRGPGILAPDGTHNTREGSWLRAALYAQAARRCLHRLRRPLPDRTPIQREVAPAPTAPSASIPSSSLSSP